jgi:hypothetical protein
LAADEEERLTFGIVNIIPGKPGLLMTPFGGCESRNSQTFFYFPLSKMGLPAPGRPGVRTAFALFPSAAKEGFFMAKLILDIQNLRKRFGDRELFTIRSLRVYEGERIGLIGQNGAGKSTLLSLIAGEEEADEGLIRRFGEAAVIRQQGDREEEVSDRALATGTETVDRYDGTVTVQYTNNRDLATITGVPGLDFMAWGAAAMILMAAAAGLARRRRTDGGSDIQAMEKMAEDRPLD